MMPRLTKIYTRKGDDGTTGLGSRTRVSKDALRVRAYGTVDELNAWLGLALALGISDRLHEPLRMIQNELFNLGAELSFPEQESRQSQVPRIEAAVVERLEKLIDEINQDLDPLENFILPGGTPGSGLLHVARTVCRRAEREVVALANEEPIGQFVLPYINRLSDVLFVMARFENREQDVPETLWDASV